MSFHLSSGIVKKVGLPGYSSYAASCSIECELDGVATQVDDALQDRVTTVFAACQQAVEAQLARHAVPLESRQSLNENGHPNGAPSGNGSPPSNGHAAGNGHAASHGLASPRQRAYIERLTLRIADLGPERLASFVQEAYGKPLRALSVQEASRLIETLTQVEAGELILENAAPLIA
jgi:hypothetical protein